jgi:hypothetical protein
MKWNDICAKLGVPNNVSFSNVPRGVRILTCYYVEEILCEWGGESVYSLDSDETATVSTEDERRLDEDFDY